MDKKAPGNDVPEEVTRESLISIAYSLPEKVPTEKVPNSKPLPDQEYEGVDSDGEDKFRSELISISYTPASENVGLPVSLEGEIKG